MPAPRFPNWQRLADDLQGGGAVGLEGRMEAVTVLSAPDFDTAIATNSFSTDQLMSIAGGTCEKFLEAEIP